MTVIKPLTNWSFDLKPIDLPSACCVLQQSSSVTKCSMVAEDKCNRFSWRSGLHDSLWVTAGVCWGKKKTAGNTNYAGKQYNRRVSCVVRSVWHPAMETVSFHTLALQVIVEGRMCMSLCVLLSLCKNGNKIATSVECVILSCLLSFLFFHYF